MKERDGGYQSGYGNFNGYGSQGGYQEAPSGQDLVHSSHAPANYT